MTTPITHSENRQLIQADRAELITETEGSQGLQSLDRGGTLNQLRDACEASARIHQAFTQRDTHENT
jgi:hypothetical protein